MAKVEGIPFEERKSSWRGPLDLLTGCYPSFLFGGGVGRRVPVFHFHEVTRSSLEPYLMYLADNGYRTLVSDEVAAFVRDGHYPGPRSVMLCFDDAWASLWSVAAPLLARYDMRAVTYVIPGRVSDEPGLRPQWNKDDEPASQDRSAQPFATWDELRALQRGGRVDIQVHTLMHARIFFSDTPVDFIRPSYAPHPLMAPLRHGDGPAFYSNEDWGAPLYPMRSAMSDALRYREDPASREACIELVRGEGPAFYERADWRGQLMARIRPGQFETPRERRERIRKELIDAREVLEEKLACGPIRHGCFPWAVAGIEAELLLEETGYETAFADRLFGPRIVDENSNPYRLMRLKHPFIHCLPGHGRKLWRKRSAHNPQPTTDNR